MSNDPAEGLGEAEEPGHLSAGFLVGGGRYTLLRQIAQGGMGVVWLAHDERLNETLALKFLSTAVRDDAVELTRLRQETQKNRKLTHVNIIRIHDLYEAPGEPAFISMEYVNGPNLWESMTQQPNGVYAWKDLKSLVRQLCDALAYAHGERVIHRDLKPTNLMLAENRRLKLADFGLASVTMQVDPASVERRFGGGTVTHMSPQQLAGEVAAVTDDIYSLGATLYDLLCGHAPFYEGDIRQQLLHTPATPLQERLAALEKPNVVPPEVAAIIMACLAKDPSKRPQSATAVAEWIALADKESTPAPVAPQPSTVFAESATVPIAEAPPRSGDWRWLAALAGLACIGLVFWFQRPSSPASVHSNVAAPINTQVVSVSRNEAEANHDPVNNAGTDGKASYPFDALPLKPLAYWPLNETKGPKAIDVVHGYNGDLVNVVLGVTEHDDSSVLPRDPSKLAAQFGSARGVESRIDIPRIDLGVPNGGNGEFSITAWVKASKANKSGAGIISKGDGLGDEQFCLDITGDERGFRFFVHDASGNWYHSDSLIKPDNKWYFLAGVCDQANSRIVLYVDGQHVTQNPMTPGGGIHATLTHATIGARKSAKDSPYDFQFIGAMDDAAIFTNALTATQVLALYEAARPTPIATASPVSAPKSQSLLDTTFDAGRGPAGEINDLALQPDGGILVAGHFNSFDGVARRGLVKLKSNGKLDDQKADVYGTINAMASQPDGRILIAGDFTAVNGMIRPRIARLEPNLALDPLFYAGEGPDGEVFSVVVDNNNNIFLGGVFTHIGGKELSRIARLDATGKIDSTFRIGTGVDGSVLAAAVVEKDKMLIGGDFAHFHNDDGYEGCLCAILHSGEFNGFHYGIKGGPVRVILNQPWNGRILIGGEFDGLGNISHKGIARLLPNGSFDPNFNTGSGVDRRVETVAVQSDHKVIIGGDFTSVNGVPRQYLARLNYDGSLDSTFFPKVVGKEVRKVLVQPDGKILVAGQFNSVEGVSRANLARLNP